MVELEHVLLANMQCIHVVYSVQLSIVCIELGTLDTSDTLDSLYFLGSD